MWLIMRGALEGPVREVASPLSRAGVEHGRRPSHRGARRMTKPIKVVVAGVGAFGQKHLDAVKLIAGVEVVSVVGRQLAPTEEWRANTACRMRPRTSPKRLRVPASMPRSWHAHTVARRADAALSHGRQTCAGRNSTRGLHGRTPSAVADARNVPDSSAWSATRADSILLTSGFIAASWRARSRSSRWTCRPIFSAART